MRIFAILMLLRRSEACIGHRGGGCMMVNGFSLEPKMFPNVVGLCMKYAVSMDKKGHFLCG